METSTTMKDLKKEIFFEVIEESPEGFNNSDYWKQIIRVNDNGERTLLHTATSQYQLIRNEELYKPLFKVVENHNGKFTRYINEFRGVRNWVEFEFPDKSFKIGEIEFKPRLTLKNSYDSSLNFCATMTILTNNTPLKNYGIGGKVKHQGKDNRVMFDLSEIGNNIVNSIEGFQTTIKPFMEQVISHKIKIDNIPEIINLICKKSMSLSDRRLDLIQNSIKFEIDKKSSSSNLTLFDLYVIISNNIEALKSKNARDTNQTILTKSIERIITK